MTAPQPATPGSDSVRAQITEVCTCGHGRDEHDDGTAHCGANEWCNCNVFVPVCAEPMRGGPNTGLPCALPRGHNGGIHDRPAAPSEPPAADSPAPGTPPPCTACGYQHNPLAWCKANVCADCGLGQHAGPDHYDDCPAAPSPVDTTEPPAETQQDDERVLVDVDHEPYADAYEWELIAARSSADTETLADRFMSSALDNIGAFDGSNNEARDRAYVRAELVALLDGLR